MLVSVLGMKILCLLFPYAVAVVEYAGNADAAYVVDVCCYCCC